jgi:hypothetical protein
MKNAFNHLSLSIQRIALCTIFVLITVVSSPVNSPAQGSAPVLGCLSNVTCKPTSMNLNGLVQLVVCKDPHLPPGLSCFNETCTVQVKYSRVTCQLNDGQVAHYVSVGDFCSDCGPPVTTGDILVQVSRSILGFFLDLDPASDPLGLTAGNPARIQVNIAFRSCTAMMFCPVDMKYCSAACSCPPAIIGGGVGGVRTSPCNQCCWYTVTANREDCRYRWTGGNYYWYDSEYCQQAGAVPTSACAPGEQGVEVEECATNVCSRHNEIHNWIRR